MNPFLACAQSIRNQHESNSQSQGSNYHRGEEARKPGSVRPGALDEVEERSRVVFEAFKPTNAWHAWLASDITVTTLRLDRLQRLERFEHERIATRAATSWDTDRDLEANELGCTLPSNPEKILAKLAQFPHGCNWVAQRWELLAEAAEFQPRWTPTQVETVWDLMGIPRGFREGLPFNPAASLADQARDMARHWKALADAVRETDAREQNQAKAEGINARSTELRQLRRTETSLHQRMRWSIQQIQSGPKSSPSPSEHRPQTTPPPIPKPPAPQPTPPAAKVTTPPVSAGTAAADASIPTGTARHTRPDPTALRERARRDARIRRSDPLTL